MADEKLRTAKDLPEDARKMVEGAGPALPKFVHRSGEVRGEEEPAEEEAPPAKGAAAKKEEDDDDEKSKSSSSKKDDKHDKRR